jgi:ribosomal protein L37AE/L43A
MATAAGLGRAIKGLSEATFRERFGTEEACRTALFEMRWREGLICPACGHKSFCRLTTRELFQCNRCKRQVRLTAGTVFQDTKLPLTVWFAAIHHLTQSRNGCAVPECRGAFSREQEDALWHQVFTAQPARRREFEPSSKRRKKRPASLPPATG